MSSKLFIQYGQIVRELRLSKNISQETLADLCSLHRTYISDVELGKRNVSLENIEKIAKALGVSLTKLFERIEQNADI
jgi:bamHI control element